MRCGLGFKLRDEFLGLDVALQLLLRIGETEVRQQAEVVVMSDARFEFFW